LHRIQVIRRWTDSSLITGRLLGVGLPRCVQKGTIAVTSGPFVVEAFLDSHRGLLLDDPIDNRNEALKAPIAGHPNRRW